MTIQPMSQISTTDLPQALKKLFLGVDQTNKPLTIMHQGKPLVVVMPAKSSKDHPTAGVMKGRGEILGNIIAPIEQHWEILQ